MSKVLNKLYLEFRFRRGFGNKVVLQGKKSYNYNQDSCPHDIHGINRDVWEDLTLEEVLQIKAVNPTVIIDM